MNERDLPRAHGGARPGSGRKATRGATVRISIALNADEQDQLDRLMSRRGQCAADVLRAALAALASL
jgi:hypothetical protein